MAVYRPTPTCPHCGEIIAVAIRRKTAQFFAGDTFIRWEYKKHSCKGKIEEDKRIKKEVDAIWEKIKSEGGKLPPFMKP